MSDRWTARRTQDGYEFEVKQNGLPVMAWVLATVMFWSVIVPAAVILRAVMRNRRYRFRVGNDGVTVGGRTFAFDRINELEIRNPASGVVHHSGPGLGVLVTGGGGYALAGVAAGGQALLSGVGNAMNKTGYSVDLQVGGRHVALARNLKEVHARGLFADIIRAVEGKL